MPKGNMVALNTPLRRQRKSTACVFYCDKTTLICGSLLSPMSPSWSRVFLWKSSMHSTTWDGRESPGGCDDWNATWQLEKTVGEMYTNYTVQIVEFAGYLPWMLMRTHLVTSLEVWTTVAKRLNSRTLLGVCAPGRLQPFSLLVVSVLAYTDCRVFAWIHEHCSEYALQKVCSHFRFYMWVY